MNSEDLDSNGCTHGFARLLPSRIALFALNSRKNLLRPGDCQVMHVLNARTLSRRQQPGDELGLASGIGLLIEVAKMRAGCALANPHARTDLADRQSRRQKARECGLGSSQPKFQYQILENQ